MKLRNFLNAPVIDAGYFWLFSIDVRRQQKNGKNKNNSKFNQEAILQLLKENVRYFQLHNFFNSKLANSFDW